MQQETGQEIEQEVRRWLLEVVIGHNFCPFARRELEAGRVIFQVTGTSRKDRMLEELVDELQRLDDDPARETILVIYANALRGFHEYLDFLEMAQALLEDQGYEGIYQLASFHPQYQFADSDFDDAANFTNRAPWPVIHILREASVAAAVDAYPGVGEVPQRNITLARDKGEAYWRGLLTAIRNGV